MITKETLDKFVVGVQNIVNEHMQTNFPNRPLPKITVDPGAKKYARIVRDNNGNRCVFCFVDLTTGDVLKAAGWKAPAKHARGNLKDEFGGLGKLGPYGPGKLGPYGPHYLR